MTTPGAPSDPEQAAAERKRLSIGIEIEALQATLVRLLQDVVDAETRLNSTQTAQLVEANEQLVLAAMASQELADTAAAALTASASLATMDALTRLPNRHTLLDRFAQAMAQARRHGTQLAVLFVDLDDFKPLNDHHGHAFGDRVLRLVAERLVSAVREGDTVSRHGGDEFLILLAEIQEPADAQAVADKLQATLAVPATVEGHELRLSASVGVAIFPEHGEALHTLTAHADAAMYAQKRARGLRSRHADLSAADSGVDSDAASGTQTQADTGADRDSAADRAAPAGNAKATAVAASTPATDTAADADPARRLADLREANERLVLAALGAQELQAAAERARLRQRAFMQAVAEELGNPLAPIRIATSMLGRLPDEEPLLPRVRQVIEQQMAQMSGLVGRLVTASAHGGGNGNGTGTGTGSLGLSLERSWVDMVAVVRAAVGTYRPVLQQHRLRLDWRPPAAPLGVVGEAGPLQQMVANLLDQACTHTPDGGRIGITLDSSADTLTLTVTDNGLGIPAQALPEVFEPFVLDLHALDFNGIGLGIGLTVARALVQAHGGSISAHSDGIRRGSRFVVTLPLAPTGAQPVPQAPQLPGAPGSEADSRV